MSIETPTAPVEERAATALSTQPAPVGPPPGEGVRRRPFRVVVRAWRQLTSMRTALLLLVLLAAAAVPGSLFPQRGIAPSQVQAWFRDHPKLAPILDRLSLFDVFHAPWFAAIYLLLFVSLVGCVIPRMRLHARAMIRRPPAAPRYLGRLPQSATWNTTVPQAEALALAAKALRRKRFRVAVGPDSLAGEKGYLRETGNLLFHLSLLLLLVGIGVGSAFGYTGEELLVQGKGFVNAAGLYDSYKPGALTSPSDLSPFQVQLNDFDASYQADGQPKTYDAHVTATTAAGAVRQDDLRVNHPLTFGNAKVYLIGHGYAIHVVVRNAAGAAVNDQVVPCIPTDLKNYLSQCTVKVADTGFKLPAKYGYRQPLQYGFQMAFIPFIGTGAGANAGSGFDSVFPIPTLDSTGRPTDRVLISAYQGDLGYGNGLPQSVYTLDTTAMKAIALPVGDQVLTPGAGTSVPLTNGFTMQVTGYSQWASLQIKDDPAKKVTLVAAVLLVVGLIGSLRVRRRRVWLRATPTGPGSTLVQAGGLSRSDAEDFAHEFRGLVTGLATAVPPAAAHHPVDGPEAPESKERPGAR